MTLAPSIIDRVTALYVALAKLYDQGYPAQHEAVKDLRAEIQAQLREIT